jgi:hypothetical protein
MHKSSAPPADRFSEASPSAIVLKEHSGQECWVNPGLTRRWAMRTVRAILVKAAAMVTVLLTAGAIIVLASGQTLANPAIAKKTGKACATCHTAPPALNDYGKKYKASH